MRLATGSWEDAEAFLGKPLTPVEGIDEVTRPAIRQRLEVFELDCPLHLDPQVAQEHGYRDVVAPQTMIMTWAMPAYWKPGDAAGTHESILWPPMDLLQIPAPGEQVFGTDSELEFFAPVHPGDRITSVSKLVDINRKRTRVGDGAFMTLEIDYTNQHGELVARGRLSGFRYTPDDTGDEG